MNFQDVQPIQEHEIQAFSEMESEGYLDPFAPMQSEPVLLSSGSIYDHDEKQNRPIAIATRRNYSCIVGASKSRKSFLKSGLIALSLGGKADNYFPNIKSHMTDRSRYIIDIDTEQSPWHAKRTFKRSLRMVDGMPQNYRSYALRKYSPEARFRFIHWLITASPYAGNIDLISIDGFADLVYDFNSLEQSNRLQSYLLYWTYFGNCHITGILHKNHGSDKPVGHIGSAVLKKAETVVFVENEDSNKDITKVTCEYTRGIAFKDFRFSVNEKGIPYYEEAF